MSENTNADIWIAGAFAAVSVDLLVYPLDTIKTRIQSPQYASLYKNGANGTVNSAALFRGLYQGIGSIVLATIPSSGAFFTTYEAMKYILTPISTSNVQNHRSVPLWFSIPTPLIHTIASTTAELVSCAILTPAEVLKQNAQMITSQPPKSKRGRHHAISSTSLQVLARLRHNPTSLWRGYGALVARNIPFTALHFPMFEALKVRLTSWREEKTGRKPQIVGAGDTDVTRVLVERCVITAISAGIAGSISATVTTPIDVVKTRIMLSATEGDGRFPKNSSVGGAGIESKGKPSSQASAPWRIKQKGKSLWSVGMEVYRLEGVRGLFRGGALRACWTALGFGLYLGSYEGGKLFLAHRRKEKERAEMMGW
ncbi:hypothetical protein AJ80_03428 [Polytolypa hystricis UAMH7299]|uniref:Mitochondrial thiamine pyrophosphate carrier 1 n=1 Tax=Polytolypa hystricis (strain UAMH7299) TaxID=1447883 RepID=A0A2B7YIB8_POLH7|nr:hypothetical protein AJ80_03428 [Polytolypa hystricis UAMH7299]